MGKTSGRGAVKAEQGFNIFIWNENMHDIIKSLEKLCLLIDGATETVIHEIQKKRRHFHKAIDGLRRKDGLHVINLDEKQNKGTDWVSLFINGNKAVYFDSIGTEYIPQEL